MIGELFSKGYACVEMADDYGSVSPFADRSDGVYRYLTDDSGDPFDLCFCLRELSIDSGLEAWPQTTYALDGDGRFNIEFGYDNISDPGAGMDRRKA
ncbi:MAG: antitoxin YezG family protein [Roseiflexus sp.]|nr:antitoxin YezG family protein [Roseiflexus sp.]